MSGMCHVGLAVVKRKGVWVLPDGIGKVGEKVLLK